MAVKSKGFYIFCALAVTVIGLTVWGFVCMDDPRDVASGSNPQPAGMVDVGEVPPSTDMLKQTLEMPYRPPMDNALQMNALRDGSVPTQDIGETGSLNGSIYSDTEMVYSESKYERLPKSPLVRFTDEMIWQDGTPNDFRVKQDAMADQARHIQEASIALNVSPRVEMGKVLGYRLVEIPEETLFSKIGMVSGDIILSINGRMPDMEPMALMFVNMVAGKQGASTIEVEHRGVRRTVHLRAAE